MAILLLILEIVLFCNIINGSPIRKRDILSDIGNFFDGLEMQVDMTIFQPVANFFTEAASEINQYVVVPGEDFFMKGQSIVVAAEYNIDMLTADLAHAIQQDVIDEVNSVDNFAVQVAQNINSNVATITTNVGNEFNNVIGPGIAGVGQQIGTAFTTLGSDLAPGFAKAGAYINAHPELIAEIILTAALIGVTAFQPELVGADAALVADIAVEVGAEAGTEVAIDIGSGAAEGIADTAAESFLEAADEPIYANIPSFWSSSEPIYANVQELLDQASGDVAENIGELEPIEESTLNSIKSEAEAIDTQLSQAAENRGPNSILTSNGRQFFPGEVDIPPSNVGIPIPYPNIDSVVSGLQAANKVLLTPKRSLHIRHPKVSTTALKASTTALKASTAAPKASTTAPAAPPFPSASLQAVVLHHYLNRTKAAKSFASSIMRNALMSGLMNSTSKTQLMPQLGASLTKMNINVPYPPTQQAHKMAIAHQIAMGNATAYSKANVTLKIQMDSNLPKDPCLSIPKISCQFGNQQGKPYCLQGCESRWYNQMNIVPLHF